MGASDRQSKKEKLFRRGAAALSATVPELTDLYGCPLCLIAYPIGALEAGVLTAEHVPPRSVGGSVICLTCSKCNNESGTRLDKHSSEKHNLMAFTLYEDSSPIPVTWRLGPESQRATARKVDGKIEIMGVSKQNRPGTAEAMAAEMHRSWGPDSDFDEPPGIGLTFRQTWDERLNRIAWLKNAYLVAFALYGYRWILHEALNPIREQILNPEDDSLDLPAVFYAEAQEQAVVLFEEPAALASCIGVFFDHHGAFLPLRNDSEKVAATVKWLQQQESSPTKLTGHRLDWPNATTAFGVDLCGPD